jgi:hypothetical protein
VRARPCSTRTPTRGFVVDFTAGRRLTGAMSALTPRVDLSSLGSVVGAEVMG